MATAFTYSSDIQGIGNLGISQARGTAADRIRTVSQLKVGERVIATSRCAGVGTYVIAGIARGTSQLHQPYADDYAMVHQIVWLTQVVLVPDTVVWSTTTTISATDADELFAYAAKVSGINA